MEAFLVSTGIVALAEMGDKTQLLSLVLAARFRKPWPIVLGILVATLANHGLAGAVGSWVTTFMGPDVLRWVLGASFIAMAVWMLIPDKFDENDAKFPKAGVFVTTLIPQLTQLIESTPGGKIPLGAAILIGASEFLSKWWLVMLLLLVAALIFFKAWKDNEANKPAWDRIKLRLPMVGPVITSRFYVQFLETMANLVANGLPLLRALELSRDATQNRSLRAGLDQVIEQVGDGRSFSKALIRTGAFPPLLIDMISVGEQTGKIDQSLRRSAERYDKELDKDLQRIMALIMPTVLIIMAGLIGTMAYLMITAIFQTISNLG